MGLFFSVNRLITLNYNIYYNITQFYNDMILLANKNTEYFSLYG